MSRSRPEEGHWEEGCAGRLSDWEPESCQCTAPVQWCSPLNLTAARSTDLLSWHAADRARINTYLFPAVVGKKSWLVRASRSQQ